MENIKSIINDYEEGLSIYNICEKYHIGKIKLKKILSDNNITLRKKGKQPIDKTNFIIEDYKKEKYPQIEGYHYIAVDKLSGETYNDYMNHGGFLTSHIKKKYNEKIPSLYNRRLFYMKTGNYWWEQWFNIIKVKDEETKKCPYCAWETLDIHNKSGAFLNHLKNEHGITIEEYIKNNPNDANYFSRQLKEIEKNKLLENSYYYVICPLCGKKMPKITNSHLLNNHNITLKEFKVKYPNIKIMSDNMNKQLNNIRQYSNLVVSKKRFISSYELELHDFLKTYNIDFETNRQILIGKEIDILIPSLNLGIEFNGLRWHSEFYGKKDKNYHLNKTILCNQKGYSLIHIFEDEYVNNKDIVFSKLKHLIKKDYDLPKIQGRKILVKEIYKNDAEIFLNKFHIQGFSSSTVYLGGFYNEELISVMSFKNGGITNKDWELTRFATNYNYRYQGVGGKLFKYFIRNYNPKNVISFADRRWTINPNNNLYTNLGFELVSITKPDYRYYNNKIDKFKRFHKFSLNKNKLSKLYGFPLTMTEKEMAIEAGFDRIWDCGLFKYVWKNDE